MSYLLAYNPYNTNLFMKNRSIDPAAQLYFNATGITGDAQQQAINSLVKSLKQSGLWSKMKAVYPFVTDNRNLFSYTEDFGNGIWTSTGATVTLNTTISPNGTLTADTIKEDSSTAQHRSYQFFNATAGVSYTASIFCKAGVGTRNIAILYGCGFGSDNRVIFNVNNGTIVASSGASGTITSVGNGWYRCTASATASASVSTCLQYQLRDGTTEIYTGDNTSSLIIWGAQVELGSTATTYQPIATTQQAFISNQFKYNLKDPRDTDAAFRLVFNGGWSFSSTGATPNGVNGYADTKLVPSSVLTNNNYHLSHYSRTQNILGSKVDIGSQQPAPRMISLTQYYGSLSVKGFVCGDYNTLEIRTNNTDTLGLLVGSRTSQTSAKMFMDGVQTGATQTISNPNALPTSNIFIGATGNGGTGQEFSDRQVAFSSIGDGLTDTEAANLYTRVQAFNQSLSRQVGVPIVSDADAQAFLNSAEITDITQANAINNLVIDLKAQGLWSKMKAIYPFVGGTASTHKWNLKDPRDLDGAYRLVFNGGWTHSSTGATPNGTNGYADTKLIPSSSLSTTSAHFTTYLRTNSTGATCDIGSFLTNARMILYSRYPSSETFATISNSGYPIGVPFPTTDSTGFWQTIRENNTNTKIFQNTIKKADGAVAFTTLPNVPFYIGAVNNTSIASLFSNRQTAFSTIGDGLTDAEALALYNTVNNYQVALSRNV